MIDQTILQNQVLEINTILNQLKNENVNLDKQTLINWLFADNQPVEEVERLEKEFGARLYPHINKEIATRKLNDAKQNLKDAFTRNGAEYEAHIRNMELNQMNFQ